MSGYNQHMKTKEQSFTRPKLTLNPPPLYVRKPSKGSESVITDHHQHEAEGGSHDGDDDDHEATGTGGVGIESAADDASCQDHSIQLLSSGEKELDERGSATAKFKQSGKG